MINLLYIPVEFWLLVGVTVSYSLMILLGMYKLNIFSPFTEFAESQETSTFYELSGGLQCKEKKTIHVIFVESASSKKRRGGTLKKLCLVFMVTLLGINWLWYGGFFTACKVVVLTDAKGIFSQRYGLKIVQSKRKIENHIYYISIVYTETYLNVIDWHM